MKLLRFEIQDGLVLTTAIMTLRNFFLRNKIWDWLDWGWLSFVDVGPKAHSLQRIVFITIYAIFTIHSTFEIWDSKWACSYKCNNDMLSDRAHKTMTVLWYCNIKLNIWNLRFEVDSSLWMRAQRYTVLKDWGPKGP